MISEEALDRISERLVNRIEELNDYMIRKLVNQIVDIGELTPSQAREIYQSVKFGNDLAEIVQKIAELSEKSTKDIYEILEEVAKKNEEFAKVFYNARGISYIPFDENIELQALVNAIAERTTNEFINIVNTSAYGILRTDGSVFYTPISKVYQELTDQAVISIATGRESYNQVMGRTLRELTKRGLRTVDYTTGTSRRTDSAVRMNILEGVRTVDNEVSKQLGEEFDANGYEIVHHKNPAPDHSENDIKDGKYDIDGKQFISIKKVLEQINKGIEKDIKLEDIDEENHRVKVRNKWYMDFDYINSNLTRPVSTLNCYHFIAPIIVGISKPIYTEDQLEEDKQANRDGFEFEGIHYTNYEGTQLQRQIETKIRQYKELQIEAKEMARATNDMSEAIRYQKRINQLTDRYNELSKVSGLPTRIERLRIEGYHKLKIKED